MERMKEYNVRYCSTYEYDIKKDIEMIQDFYPETEHLVFVSDNTYNGLAELAWFKKNLQHFPQLSRYGCQSIAQSSQKHSHVAWHLENR